MSDPSGIARRAVESTRELSEQELRRRVVDLAFGGDDDRFRAFVAALREGVPADTTVVLRGSVVTGVRWNDGTPFDADGPGTSDLDLTFVGGESLRHWDEDAFYIPKLHTRPLSEDHPEVAPTFVPLRNALCRIAGRPVNIQATSSLVQYVRDVLFGQPYLTILGKREGSGSPADEREYGEDARAPDDAVRVERPPR